MPNEREQVTLKVPSKGGEPPKEGVEPQFPPEKDFKGKDEITESMSQEDIELKERLELSVERLSDPSEEVRTLALELLRKEIREATSSMTSVPKPLKFLTPHWSTLQTHFTKLIGNPTDILKKKRELRPYEKLFADIMSVLAMNLGEDNKRELLQYKLIGDPVDISAWGHEYVRSLSGEIGEEWNERVLKAEDDATEVDTSDLLKLINVIIPFNLSHNAEHEAVDLLLEVGKLEILMNFKSLMPAVPAADLLHGTALTGASLVPGQHDPMAPYARVCSYLLKATDYMGDPDDALAAMEVAFAIYLDFRDFPCALRTAMKIGGSGLNGRLDRIFGECTDAAVKKQLAYILGSACVPYETDDDDLNGIINNHAYPTLFANLAKELDVVEALTPQDIYKSQLGGERLVNDIVDSAKGNLASTYVNAFVNAAFGSDKVVLPESSGWLGRNRDLGQTAVAASVGMLHMWNDAQISNLDKFFEANETNPKKYIRAGALLGVGLMHTNIRSDVPLALIEDILQEPNLSPLQEQHAILGLGIAYAGSRNQMAAEVIVRFLEDVEDVKKRGMDTVAYASLALGFIYAGAGASAEEYAIAIVERIMAMNETEQTQAIAPFLSLGLALIFLGRTTESESVLELLKVMNETPFAKLSHALVLACSYAATGNVLVIQQLLRICAEHPEIEDAKKKAEAEKEGEQTQGTSSASTSGTSAAGATGAAGADAAKKAENPLKYMYLSVATLGIGIVACGDPISISMATRMAEHLLQYGDSATKVGVPIALALCYASNPEYSIIDSLSRLANDSNPAVAQAAILSLGIAGAGTNNSRIAGLLRTLHVYYKLDNNMRYILSIAQGFLHMGKGLLRISPFFADRELLHLPAMSGLLTVLLGGINSNAIFQGNYHTLLFTIAPAMRPCWLMTVDEESNALPVEVRVGTALDTVGAVGKPKAISGFQTHTAPVLVGVVERAEIADELYGALTNVLEGIVIVRVNEEVKKNRETEKIREKEKQKKERVGTGTRGRSDLKWE